MKIKLVLGDERIQAVQDRVQWQGFVSLGSIQVGISCPELWINEYSVAQN